MKWYGNLTNRLMENVDTVEKIEVGTGMTEYLWSDRNAYEVVAVEDQKHITVRELGHEHIGEAYENKWRLFSDPKNPEEKMVRRGKYWYWGHVAKETRANVSFGIADYYYDYEF